MTPKVAMTGPGCFQWNKGGWIGSQVGSTCWLLVGAAVLAVQAPIIAVIWLVCFSIVNAIGTWLWLRRDRVPPYSAFQVLLAILGIMGLLALVSFDVLRPDGARIPMTGNDSLWTLSPLIRGDQRAGYQFFVVGVPAMMAYTALMEHFARRARARASSGL